MIRKIAFITALILPILAWADKDLQFRHYAVDDGAPSNCVRDIIQDDDGFIWFATDGGVSRFDGHRFKTYKLGIDSPELHDDNYAMALCNANGQIWLGTDSHLYLYDQQADIFRHMKFPDSNGKDIPTNVRGIIADHDGNLWISVVGMGIVKARCNDGKMSTEVFSLPKIQDGVIKISVDSRNDIWALSNIRGSSAYRFDKNENKFKEFIFQYHSNPMSLPALAIAEDGDHNHWIGTWDGCLYSFDPYRGDCELAYQPKNNHQDLTHIHTLAPAGPDLLYIGSDAGFGVFNTHTSNLELYVQDEARIGAISDKFVYPIIIDKEGGTWIGTFYGGINYFPPNLKVFEKYQKSHAANTVSGNVISGFAEDGRGNIYIASVDGGLSRLAQSSDAFQNIPLPAANSNNINALMIDGNDLWIGSYAGGVMVYNIDSGAIRCYKSNGDKSNGLPDNSSYAMLRSADNELWIASGMHLCRFDRAAGKFERIKNLGALIVDIDEDKDGNLWISTQGQGIYVFHRDKGVFDHYLYTAQTQKIPHNHINAVTIDRTGTVWVASPVGLLCYDSLTDNFVKQEIPFVNTPVLSVIEDQGMLWLTTQYGLIKFIATDNIEVYTQADGLCSSQFVPNSIFKASNGRIFIGTRAGFNAFFPFQIKLNQNIPHVVFTGLAINNMELKDGDPHLPMGVNHLDKLVLKPDDSMLTINFASLSFTNPDKNQYKYRLIGIDKDWVSVGDRSNVTYNNLAPGNYKFEVIGSNSDNLWSQNAAVLNVEVLPPWFKTWPMKALYVIGIFALLFYLVRALLQKSEKKHKDELTKISNDKEIEVYQAKLSFFTMVAHEIRTPVSLIIGPLEKLMQSPEKFSNSVQKDLTVIERNSQRLLFLVNQLLDFKKVEEQGYRCQMRSTNIVQLIQNIVVRFQPSLEHKGIQLKTQYDLPEDFQVDIDSEGITKLVSNLLNNARKFTKDSIEVTVAWEAGATNFEIIVSDNGVGIDKNERNKIFRPFYQVSDTNHSKGGTGLGLSIVQAVVETHNGRIVVDSELGKGTSFIVTLPVHQENALAPIEEVKEEEAPAVEKGEGNGDEKPRMLVVDDNEELCTFIANNFSDKYEVITAENGEEALHKIQKNEFALIISDWMMPKMDGVELCKAVRADKAVSHIPFVLLTAKTDNYSKVEGLNCGADAYVEKPFSLQVLEARIDNLLHMREMLRNKYSQTPLEPIETIAPHSADNEFLTQLSAIIEKNFSNPELDIDFLASKMDMSRSSLYSKIRSLVDVTPNDLIRITRLKHAAKLLVDGRYRISEVCYMVGFNSSSYFAKCFQKQFGLTPSEFVAKSK